MSYNIKLEVFEGPFDLLVYLIEKAQMDIYDIAIAKITQQYIEHINLMQKLNLEVISEFLVLAATLIEIKSKMLLPQNESKIDQDIDDDPRTELVEKLLEYKKYKNAAEILKEKQEKSEKVIFKVKEDLEFENNHNEYIDIDIDQFVKAFNIFLKKKKKIYDIQKKYSEVKNEKISIEEKVSQIRNYFKRNTEAGFINLLSDYSDKYEIIITFMAMLELIKQRFITAKQHALYEDIILIKNVQGETAV